MGFLDRLFGEVHVPGADGRRVLDVPSSMNLRELGHFPTPDGPTRAHRFLRCGSTRCLSQKDREWLRAYGLTHVLDLRGHGESPELTCPYARDKGVIWKNVTLFGTNLSADEPRLHEDLDYLARGYLAMLRSHDAIRQALLFLAEVPQHECALFHCAAGMDRTGMVSMLLLGVAGVSRQDIVRDYLYSFGLPREVDRYVDATVPPTPQVEARLGYRRRTIEQTYDALVGEYGSPTAYALACGLGERELALLRRRLLED